MIGVVDGCLDIVEISETIVIDNDDFRATRNG
jgi:hypothetical protein